MLEGEWQILAVEYAGEAMPGRTGRLQIIDGRFAIQIGGAPREVGGVELDATTTPARLDLVWRDSGGDEARRLRAIARVRGQLLQLCYFPDAADTRPGQFDSAATESTPPAVLIRCRRSGITR
jgi:uncharacterized protein (TIGR03067 family)